MFCFYTLEVPKWYFALGKALLLAIFLDVSLRILLELPFPIGILPLYWGLFE
jgi:hypothetical protein